LARHRPPSTPGQHSASILLDARAYSSRTADVPAPG
jgi:hypothetical protein